MEQKPRVPSVTLRRKAADLGIHYFMSDEDILDKLKKAKVVKAPRQAFLAWLRYRYGYKNKPIDNTMNKD